jgi:hypothetical protein
MSHIEILEMDARVFFMYIKYEELYWKKKAEAQMEEEEKVKRAEEFNKNQELMSEIANDPVKLAELEREAMMRSQNAKSDSGHV